MPLKKREPTTVRFEYRLNCLNKRHVILLMSDGSLILKNHLTQEDREATEVQEALSGQKCKCFEILRYYKINGRPRTGPGYREFNWQERNLIHSTRSRLMPREIREAAIKADERRDRRYLLRAGLTERVLRKNLSAIRSGMYSWYDLTRTSSYYAERFKAEMFRTDLPEDANIRRKYLVAKTAAWALGKALSPVTNRLTVYCDNLGDGYQKHSLSHYHSGQIVMITKPEVFGDDLYIDTSWYSKVYLSLNRQPVIDGHFIMEVKGDDLSWVQARAAVQREDYRNDSYINLIPVEGWLFRKPFGGFGFMANAAIAENLVPPPEVPKNPTIEEAIAFTDLVLATNTQ